MTRRFFPYLLEDRKIKLFCTLNIVVPCIKIFIYLTVLGLSCGPQDLHWIMRRFSMWCIDSSWAHGLRSCGAPVQLLCGIRDLSSLTWNQTLSHTARQIFNHWTTREVLPCFSRYTVCPPSQWGFRDSYLHYEPKDRGVESLPPQGSLPSESTWVQWHLNTHILVYCFRLWILFIY